MLRYNGDVGFVDELNAALRERGWEPRDLVEASGITSGGVSLIMSGQRNPSTNSCRKIAKALQLPAETVLRWADHLPDAPDDNEMLAEAQYLFSRLPDDEQERFLAQMRAILELRRDRKKTR